MKRKLLTAIAVIILGLFSYLILPRSYEVPPTIKRSNTDYWQKTDGSKIAFTKLPHQGDTTATPILYLHGGPGGFIKQETITALSVLTLKGHDVYLYDQIGSGFSDRLDNIADYTLQRHTNDLVEIIDKIKLSKVILIAHSWGCILATQSLTARPNNIEKVILSGPGPILPIQSAFANLKAPDSLHLIKPAFSNGDAMRAMSNQRINFIEKCATTLAWKWASDKEMDDYFTVLNQALSKSTVCDQNNLPVYPSGGGYYSHIMTMKSLKTAIDRRAQLKNINIPVLLLRGQCDNQAWGFTQEYLEILPNSSLQIIENSGHDLIREAKENYLKQIILFLQSKQ